MFTITKPAGIDTVYPALLQGGTFAAGIAMMTNRISIQLQQYTVRTDRTVIRDRNQDDQLLAMGIQRQLLKLQDIPVNSQNFLLDRLYLAIKFNITFTGVTRLVCLRCSPGTRQQNT